MGEHNDCEVFAGPDVTRGPSKIDPRGSSPSGDRCGIQPIDSL